MKILNGLNLSASIILDKYSVYLFPLAVFSLAFYLQYSVAFLGLDLHHDLLMFDAARNFYSGQIPYKDFFYQYNLGSVILHGAALGVLGLKIISLKQITVLFYALIALLIYVSCAFEGSRRSGFLLSILWALLSPFYMPAMSGYHPWPTIYMMFLCMAGLFCLQLAIRKNPLAFSFLAGVFFCLAFWFKQVAIFQIIAVATWLALNIWPSLRGKADQLKYIKIFSGYALGGLVASIPFFVYLYTESAILAWWIDAFVFNKYFAADSQNATGMGASLKILFPIARDMGYKSIFWALCPLVLCIVTFQSFIWRGTTFRLSKSQKESMALFTLAGFAGWVEYFPLPHPFHTQIFMAPTFVVIGMLLGKHLVVIKEIKKYFLNFLALYIFIGCGVYEGIRHIEGWNKKRHAYGKDAIVVNSNSNFDGLKIFSSEEKSLQQFYKKLIELNSYYKGREFMPLSVDPVRGLVPGEVNRPSEFKMGVDWTWPNELVEPGFSSKINSRIMSRQQPIYADSLIYIPGYMPVAILEMKSPISSTHTIYKPQAEESKLLVGVKESAEILYVTNTDFDFKSRNTLFDWASDKIELNLIPFDGLSEAEIKSIKNIQISAIQEEDFPHHLSALQMRYLEKVGKNYSGDLPGLYRLDDQEGGALRDNIKREDKKNLAFFMLSSGKLIAKQDRPVYASTLTIESFSQPALVEISRDSVSVRLLWSIKKDRGGMINDSMNKSVPAQTYLAIPHLLNKNGSKFIVIQIELKNGKMKNYFYSFLNE